MCIDAVAVFGKPVPSRVTVIAAVAGLLDKPRGNLAGTGLDHDQKIGKPAAAAEIQLDGERPVAQRGIRKCAAGVMDHHAVLVGLQIGDGVDHAILTGSLAGRE